MNIKHFIFSEKKSDRIKRHVLYCSCYWAYFTFFHNVTTGVPATSYFRNIPYATLEAFALFLPQIFFTYALLSFVLPKYLLKNKYLFSFVWIVFFLMITSVFVYLMLSYVNQPIMEAVLPRKYMVYNLRTSAGNIFMGLVICGKGALTVSAGACSIRLVKYWHLKEKRNLELIKEKTEAQLQLLTAQVHPNFLFNTLNNIYSKAQTESPGSAKMIDELSHILRYVLYEGKRELVPLENELQMLIDYINLEKMRYDNKLDLYLSLPSKTEGVHIAPLLLLPFVENCFKHGTSKMLNNPWINLKIELRQTSFFMKLMNGKKDLQKTNTRKGTGIENVRKRLDLLYKNKYDLKITEDDEVFVVNLAMELVKITPTAIAQMPPPTVLKKEYA
jgi:two-component system, LytTR family, sensor kinase